MPVGDWNFLSCAQKIIINELIFINELTKLIWDYVITDRFPFVHRL